MHEAYRPPCIKYSFRCSVLGKREGTPVLPWWGAPQYYPCCGEGYLCSILVMGVYPVLSWLWVHQDRDTPGRDMGPVTRVPSGKDMRPVEVLWDGGREPLPLERT